LRDGGKTRAEALAHAREAIEGYLLSLLDDGLPLPSEETATVEVRVPG
jgi:predicted RNase H-like HicB family nuclease